MFDDQPYTSSDAAPEKAMRISSDFPGAAFVLGCGIVNGLMNALLVKIAPLPPTLFGYRRSAVMGAFAMFGVVAGVAAAFAFLWWMTRPDDD